MRSFFRSISLRRFQRRRGSGTLFQPTPSQVDSALVKPKIPVQPSPDQVSNALDKLKNPEIPQQYELTSDDYLFLTSLDDSRLLAKRINKTPCPGSFSGQKQYSEQQTLVTKKLECLAELLSAKPEAKLEEKYLQLSGKLALMLRTYIESRSESYTELNTAIKQLTDTVKTNNPLTTAEVKLLARLDDKRILGNRKPSIGSIAAQVQYSEAQTLVTNKMRCLGALISNYPFNPTLDFYVSLMGKMTQLLTKYIRHKEDSAPAQGQKLGFHPIH